MPQLPGSLLHIPNIPVPPLARGVQAELQAITEIEIDPLRMIAVASWAGIVRPVAAGKDCRAKDQ